MLSTTIHAICSVRIIYYDKFILHVNFVVIVLMYELGFKNLYMY